MHELLEAQELNMCEECFILVYYSDNKNSRKYLNSLIFGNSNFFVKCQFYLKFNFFLRKPFVKYWGIFPPIFPQQRRGNVTTSALHGPSVSF